MSAPSVYLDECVDHGLVIRLRRRGFNVTTAQAEGIVGVDDETQLSFAAAHELLILTHNSRHFQRLHRSGMPHAGILLLPRSPLDRLEIRAAMMLDWIATYPTVRSRLFRWHDLQLLLNRGYAVPGYDDEDQRRATGQVA